MPLFLHLGIVWLQNKLAWSNSRQAWVERFAGLAAVGAGAAGWWLGGRLAPPQQALLWALLLIGSAVLLRRGWLKLFGPVLFYDLVLTARRRRHAVLRCLYAALLIYGMVVLYLFRLAQGDLPVDLLQGNLFAFRKLPTHVLTELTNIFFFMFFFVQMTLTLILTPAYTAGAIAAEKERQTLDALLATDLRNREIVLSMLVSRLANLVLILLTGLPILSLMEFLGGLDPNLVLAMYAATGLTLASLGCFGILNSVRFAKPRTAVMRTYLWTLLYLGASSLSWLLLLPALNLAHFPSTDTWKSSVEFEDMVEWFNAGNPGSAVAQLIQGLGRGTPLGTMLPDALRAYAWFHGVIAAGCLGLAVARFRAWTLPGSSDAVAKAGFFRKQSLPPLWSAWLRRRVGRWPMLWKELFVETGVQRGWLSWLGIGTLVALSFLPAVHLVGWFNGFGAMQHWGVGIRPMMNVWIRVVSALIGCLLLIQVGIRAAGGISGERARQTLESLLITPLEARAILGGKWLGAVLNPRWAWAWLGLIWAWGVAVGALSPRAVPGFVLAWLVYAGFMASLGLYLSVAAGTTQRATIWTLLITILVTALAALTAFDFLPQLDGYGLIPPVALGMLPCLHGDARELSDSGFGSLKSVFLGLALWAALALFLAYLAGARFRVLIGRKGRRADAAAPDAAPQAVVAVAASLSTPVPVPARQATELPSSLSLSPAAATTTRMLPASPQVVAGPRSKTTWFRKSRDDDGPRKPPERWRRLKALRPAIPLLIPFAVLIGVYLVQARRDERRLEQALAEADRLDPGWHWEELEARRAQVPDVENGRFPIEAAQRSIPKPRSADDWFLKRTDEAFQDELSPEVQLNDAQRHALTQDLTEAVAALKEARRLAGFPRGRFPLAWEKDYLSFVLPHLSSVRSAARLLSYDATRRADQSDPDGAVVSCRAVLNAGRAIDDEPTLISQMTRNSIRTLAVRGIERTLAQGEPSDDALVPLQGLLERELNDNLLLIALRGERAYVDRLAEDLQTGQVPLQRLFAFFGSGGGRMPWNPEAFVSGSLKQQRVALVRITTQAVEAAKLPPEQRAVRVKALVPTVANQPWLVQMLLPGLFQFEVNFRRFEAELRCTLVMVAVERFRQRHGRWPASLNELVPEFLTRLPTDPCNGLPLCYRRLADGVVIYSVGDDGVDNGGKLLRRGGITVGVDWGVRLWDVPRRRQPASGPGPAGAKTR